jgi:hypothetical protein
MLGAAIGLLKVIVPMVETAVDAAGVPAGAVAADVPEAAGAVGVPVVADAIVDVAGRAAEDTRTSVLRIYADSRG